MIMNDPIIDETPLLRVKPFLDEMANNIGNDVITVIPSSANDNMSDKYHEDAATNDDLTQDPCALLTAFQEDLRQLNIYYAETLFKGASYELHDNTFVIYPADASLTEQIKDILEAPLSLIVKQKYNKSVEIVMRE